MLAAETWFAVTGFLLAFVGFLKALNEDTVVLEPLGLPFVELVPTTPLGVVFEFPPLQNKEGMGLSNYYNYEILV